MSDSSPAPTAAPRRRSRADAADAPLVRFPWDYLGISRSAWFKMRAANTAPKAVTLPGGGRPLYRKADLDRWVAGLKTARVAPRKATAATPGQAAE